MVDSFTFEVARAVDRDLSERLGYFSSDADRQRLVAILFILKDAGLLSYYEHHRKTWLCFGPPDTLAWQLDEISDLTGGSVEDASKYFVSLAMRKSEISRSMRLSKRYRAELDQDVVESSWRKVRGIVSLIAKNRACLTGTELENGLIMEDLTRATEEEIFYIWFSLGDKADRKPLAMDLDHLSVSDGGRSVRWPITATVSVSRNRPAFVSLMGFRQTSARKAVIAVMLERIAEEKPSRRGGDVTAIGLSG
ncbi:hypothetical protein XH97_00170 [Bradyrhizobium sp. CCBAU 53380]|nr:hypothetical protein [Bradyrhizobium sp. CCBAU 53380]